MNILFISHENALNGANKSMINLIDTMSNVHNFYVWCRQGNKGELIEELKKRNVTIYCEPFYCWCTYKPKGFIGLVRRKLRWHIKEKVHNVKAARNIGEFIKENRIEIIHMNSSIIDIGTYLKKLYNIPLIWHIREFGKEDFGWIPLCSEKQYYDEIDSLADKVVVISKAIENKYKNKISQEKICVVYNGIPIETQVEKNEYDLQRKTMTFLQTGVLSEAKGQRTAIEALKELHNYGYKDVKLLFAGRGNPENVCSREDIEGLNIEFLGQVKDMNVVRNQADVELVCSKSEAFGRVTVEAMMSGLPVIGSNSGGTPELIKDGVTGYIYIPNCPKDLAGKMKNFITNPSLIEKMGRKASEYSREKFNITVCTDQIEQIYEEVTEKFYGTH